MRFIITISIALFPLLSKGAFTAKNRPYDVEKYSLRMELDPSQDLKDFAGSLKIELTTTAATDTIEFDAEDLKIERIDYGPTRKALKWDDKTAGLLTVKLPKPATPGQKHTITIGYHGPVQENHGGFFKVKDPDAAERGFLYFTHFEPLKARAFIPCNDEPYDKASVEIAVVLPAGYEAISNGKKVLDRAFKKGKDKWHEVKWAQTKPHSTYLISLAAGKFKVLADDKAKPPVAIYANEKKIDRAQFTLDATRKSMAALESYLGVPYPWDKYSTVGLPTFLWGGMENTSSTHMNEERMLLNDPGSASETANITRLVAHELAHQWFGNLVTLKWWNDVWLNEAFATYMTLVAEKKIFSNERAELDFVAGTWDNYFEQEDGPRSHPIVQKEIETPDDGFDAINYTKGANVLRMLGYYLGEERLRKSLKLYLTQYNGKNATYLDFFKSVEQATGEDLSAFRDGWLLQRGYPVIRYSGTWDKDASKYELVLKQQSNHPDDNSKFRFRIPVTFTRNSAPVYKKTISVTMGEELRKEKVELPAEPQMVSVNNGGVVLAKIIGEKLEEKDLAVHALSDADPVLRFWAAWTLSEGLRDGKSISAFADKSLGYVLTSDPSPFVRVQLLATLQKTPGKALPSELSTTIVRLAKESQAPGFETTKAFAAEPFGWRNYRSALLGALGRVGGDEAVEILNKTLVRVNLPLDDLGDAASAVAKIGDETSLSTLNEALKLHSARGYRYRYQVQLAFASVRDARVVPELKRILETSSPDLAGRLGRVVAENPPVRASAEWAVALGDFLVKDRRLGDEVKARVLRSVEKEKTADVRLMLEKVVQTSESKRIRSLCRQILDKANNDVAKK